MRTDAEPNWIFRQWRRGLSTANLVVGATGISVLCVAVAAGIGWANSWRDGLHVEFIKAFLQIPIVVILGTVAKLLGDVYQSTRQKRETELTFWLDLRQELVAAYSEIKQARRLLKSRGVVRLNGKITEIRVPVYDAQMEAVSNGRLRIESLWRRIEARTSGQDDVNWLYGRLIESLHAMEEYFGEVNGEWEARISELPASAGTTPADSLPILLNVLQRMEEGGTFRTGFRGPYVCALGELDRIQHGRLEDCQNRGATRIPG